MEDASIGGLVSSKVPSKARIERETGEKGGEGSGEVRREIK
jgi:hypothetical protein